MDSRTIIINTDIFADAFDAVFGIGKPFIFHTADHSSEEGIWLNVSNKIQSLLKEYNMDALAPSYPVSNLSIDSEGTCYVEIAVCGFDKKDLKVSRKGDILIVTGEIKEPEEGNSSKPQRQYAYRRIAQRNFTIKYRINEKFDFEKLKVSLDKGILTLTLPLKEENKPTEQEYNVS